jgi:hypothetical protein
MKKILINLFAIKLQKLKLLHFFLFLINVSIFAGYESIEEFIEWLNEDAQTRFKGECIFR